MLKSGQAFSDPALRYTRTESITRAIDVGEPSSSEALSHSLLTGGSHKLEARQDNVLKTRPVDQVENQETMKASRSVSERVLEHISPSAAVS